VNRQRTYSDLVDPANTGSPTFRSRGGTCLQAWFSPPGPADPALRSLSRRVSTEGLPGSGHFAGASAARRPAWWPVARRASFSAVGEDGPSLVRPRPIDLEPTRRRSGQRPQESHGLEADYHSSAVTVATRRFLPRSRCAGGCLDKTALGCRSATARSGPVAVGREAAMSWEGCRANDDGVGFRMSSPLTGSSSSSSGTIKPRSFPVRP